MDSNPNHKSPELRRQEEFLRVALEASGMGQWHWVIEGDLITWDRTTKRIYGVDPEREDFSFADAMKSIHPDDAQRAADHVQRAIVTGEFPPIELRLRLGEEVRWIRTTGAVHADGDGKALEIFGGVIDVTEERNMRAREERARTMASLGELAGGVAHDFNNLLVAILGNIELTRDTEDFEERQLLLDEAAGACHRAADLAHRLLAFGRRQETRFEPIDLRSVLKDAKTLLLRLLPEDIQLDFEFDPEPLVIQGDRNQLEQALINLCLNSRDALEGRPSPRLSIRTRRLGLERVEVIVEDNGEGIDENNLPRIFEPFFSTRGRGSGLGLASVHGTVKQHGAEIDVSSMKGQGSRFTLRFELDESSGDGWEAQSLESSGPQPAPGGTILIAEDDDAVRRVVVRTLKRSGFEVLSAKDGEQALRLFEARGGAVDAVVLDVVMPQVSGIEVARQVHRQRSELPIIITTGYSEDALSQAPASSVFIPKPYDPKRLIAALSAALG